MRGSVCTCYIHTGSAKIARARARTCIGDVLLTATRSSTHLADAKRGCPSLSSRKSTPHSTQGYRWAHASHTQLRREREMALGESGEAARGPRAGCHRTCEIAASRRGSTESSAPQKPIHDRRRPSAIGMSQVAEHEFVSVLSVNLENKRNQFSLRSPSRAPYRTELIPRDPHGGVNQV